MRQIALARFALMAVTTLAACGETARAQQKPAASEPRLQQLVGTWSITKTAFTGAENAVFIARPAAGGQAVQSVWTHGANEGRYEANALWAYDASSGQVRVFEVNTLGHVVLHVGRFDDPGALVLDQRAAGDALVRRTTFTWSGNTMQMDATFYVKEKETTLSTTMVRQ